MVNYAEFGKNLLTEAANERARKFLFLLIHSHPDDEGVNVISLRLTPIEPFPPQNTNVSFECVCP